MNLNTNMPLPKAGQADFDFSMPCVTQSGTHPGGHVDYLTGALNREGFIKAARELVDSAPTGTYAIVHVNIQGFRAVNSIFGFSGGDDLLRRLVTYLNESFMSPEAVGRLEADHLVCLARVENLDFELIKEGLSRKYADGKREAVIYGECGIYVIEDTDASIGSMIDKASAAVSLMKVKSSSIPVAIYQEGADQELIDRRRVVGDFERALKEDEFTIYCQPVVDANTGEIASAEALVRWIRPGQGTVSPGIFIPALEESGLVSKLSQRIVEITHMFQHRRVDQGKPVVPISVNLSWVDFYDTELMEWILEELEHKDEPAHLFRFEITETSYAALERNNSETLERLKACGAKILLDDFGSGYSSFSTLSDYEFDILKLDLGFVQKMESDQRTRSIVQAIIGMAHSLGMQVVAEGAETETQAQLLRDYGCDYIQGYLYYKPMPMDEFGDLLG